MDIDDMEYQGEEIKIGGKTRHIRYAIVGLKLLAQKYGSVVDAFDKMQTMNLKFDEKTMDDLALLLYAGLVHEDEKLTLAAVENMADIGNMRQAFDKILNSFKQSTPEPEEAGKKSGE
jgi:carbonic anhydrase